MGWAPLHKAAQAGASEVAHYLVSEKSLNCDINILDSEKHTPLHLACGATPEVRKAGHIAVIQHLLSHGANPNAEDDGGYTPLDLAVIQNYREAVELLLSHGASPNHMNGDKFSPLHAAVRSQFGDVATLLLRHGADFNLADGKGRTPLQIAQRVGMRLQIDDEVMKKQPAIVAATSSAAGIQQEAPRKSSEALVRPRSDSKPVSSESTPAAPPAPSSAVDKSATITTTDEDIQKEIEKELADV